VNQSPAPAAALALDASIGGKSIAIGGALVRVCLMRAVMSQAYRAFVDTLSLMSRFRRFHFFGHTIHESLIKHLTQVDQSNHVALAAFDQAEPERMIAEARYIIDKKCSAEWAIAVADHWQQRGIGHALASLLISHARSHQVARIWGTVQRSNQPMQSLARRLGFTQRYYSGDAQLVLIERRL
jgi:acetyltransferase